MHDSRPIRAILEQIEDWNKLTAWEVQFVRQMLRLKRQGVSLTEYQSDTLQRIYAKSRP